MATPGPDGYRRTAWMINQTSSRLASSDISVTSFLLDKPARVPCEEGGHDKTMPPSAVYITKRCGGSLWGRGIGWPSCLLGFSPESLRPSEGGGGAKNRTPLRWRATRSPVSLKRVRPLLNLQSRA